MIGSKHKIGVLIPQSNAYPTMGKSFLNGMRLAIEGIETELVIESIGFGSDQKQLINSFQKLCYQENVKITTGIIGHTGFKELSDFTFNNQETLLAANFGSKRPIKLPNGVFQNSLGLYDSLHKLVHYLLEHKKYKVATSTCYYEAGYGFIEALDDIITQEEHASFAGHFITPLHPRENESELMDLYFNETKPDAIVAFHNGIFAKEHASYLSQNKLHKKHPLYTLPFSAEDALINEFPDVFNQIKTISSWYPELDNDTNISFAEMHQKQFRKKPDVFALLGYENGLVIKSALIQDQNNLSTAIQNISIGGPRGIINFNNDFNTTNFNHHIWENTFTEGSFWKRQIFKNLNKNPLNSLTGKENNQGWFNTYLCH
ncbi:ABC-type branched-subunit amino acid transport system substrate-binding protein [Aquimarina sp. MAR_2010_214]|uniref:ABC transporter substrate-binding protein n=1 Tax=Aquimarina sp. MAR_2010_214 TaxID=1250026 RepID=UPI000C7015D1|nr:ABC transporter substrate-binding protein [Aquimarina sp. MAR_2010_214]PKV49355.1 ABC-type branched-subunit amino acid transport system substrate-binding protein [Aquimarina sp. MAR_2010_214]